MSVGSKGEESECEVRVKVWQDRDRNDSEGEDVAWGEGWGVMDCWVKVRAWRGTGCDKSDSGVRVRAWRDGVMARRVGVREKARCWGVGVRG